MGETASKPAVDLKDHQTLESFQQAITKLEEQNKELVAKHQKVKEDLEQQSKKTRADLAKYASLKADADCLCNANPTLLWLFSSAREGCVEARGKEMSKLTELHEQNDRLQEIIKFKGSLEASMVQLDNTINANKKYFGTVPQPVKN